MPQPQSDFWDERDRRYNDLRSQGFGPDCAQDQLDQPKPHDPSQCAVCKDWAANDEVPKHAANYPSPGQ